jgi:hypothetical protein
VNKPLNSAQIERWVLEIRDNLQTLQRKKKFNDEKTLNYLSQQYDTLLLLNAVIEGKVRMVGVPQPKSEQTKNND